MFYYPRHFLDWPEPDCIFEVAGQVLPIFLVYPIDEASDYYVAGLLLKILLDRSDMVIWMPSVLTRVNQYYTLFAVFVIHYTKVSAFRVASSLTYMK